MNTYIDFTDLFCKLSPYQLGHLSEVLLCKLEEGCDGKLFEGKSKSQITSKDVEYALTEAMRDIGLEMRELQLSTEQLKLTQTRTLFLSPKKVAA